MDNDKEAASLLEMRSPQPGLPLGVGRGLFAGLALFVVLCVAAVAGFLREPGPVLSGHSSKAVSLAAEWQPPKTGWHRAVLNTLIREGKSLNSTVVQALPLGKLVHVVDRAGRRVQIDYPAHGWTSAESSRGEPILLWNEPEALGKGLWSLPGPELHAVLVEREVLRENLQKQKTLQQRQQIRQGVDLLMRRIKSGELGEEIEQGLSKEHLLHLEKEAEDGLTSAEQTAEQVVNGIAENNVTAAQKALQRSPLGKQGSDLLGDVANAVSAQQAVQSELKGEDAMFHRQEKRWQDTSNETDDRLTEKQLSS